MRVCDYYKDEEKMNHKVKKVVLPVAFVFVMVGLALPAQGKDGKKDKPTPLKQTSPMMGILVNVDEEMGEYIKDAEKMIARKDYADAIEILQILLDRPGQCFAPTEDPRCFITLTARVNEVIGQLPPEGMKLYRRLYDIKAGRMFRAASERFDESALRDIACRYFHTSFGGKALNLLGGIMFDRGEFSQAARCWQRILSSLGGREEAVLLAKIAVAYHFTGDADRSTEAMKLLIGKHPKTRAVIGSKEQNIASFARRVLAGSVPFADSIRAKGWPSLAGAPDSTAVMSPCKPVMDRRWTVPGGDIRANPDIKAALGLTSVTFQLIPKSARVRLNAGRIRFTLWTGSGARRLSVPPLIHPVVTGTTVLYRSAESVFAHDLTTGEKLWESKDFSLFRRIPKASTYRPTPMEERGLWTLTAGGGRVFAVGEFFPARESRARGRNLQSKDTSVLAALSVNGEGCLLWRIGQGEGNTDVVRGGKFLAAPTFVAGRLYTLVKYKSAHYLVCLDAENGAVVWESLIGQMPIHTLFNAVMVYMPDEGSAPAVAGGRVFVVTNKGVIVAFDADTGRPTWAYQYESNKELVLKREKTIGALAMLSSPHAPNPVVVTEGRVYCLPADCDKLLALRTDTGRLEWSIDRKKLGNLTALGNSRLLLSGKGLRIIDAATGKEVWTAKKVSGVHGRPAVTTDAILASGKGEIVRVSLKDFSVTRLPVKQPDAILGNLICVDGKLIAANAAGVSAYFPAVSTRSIQE